MHKKKRMRISHWVLMAKTNPVTLEQTSLWISMIQEMPQQELLVLSTRASPPIIWSPKIRKDNKKEEWPPSGKIQTNKVGLIIWLNQLLEVSVLHQWHSPKIGQIKPIKQSAKLIKCTKPSSCLTELIEPAAQSTKLVEQQWCSR